MSLSHRLLYMRFSRWVLLPAFAILVAGAATANPAPTPASQVHHEQAVYGFWTVTCTYLSSSIKTKTCIASLPVRHGSSKEVVVILVVGPDNKGKKRFDTFVPTSTLVQPGVLVKFDSGGEITLPILSCGPHACIASLLYSEAIATQLSRAKTIKVQWTNAISGRIETAFPVKGTREALAALVR
jgi:invasion protein IalB